MWPGVVEEAAHLQLAPLLRLLASEHLWPSAQDAATGAGDKSPVKCQQTLERTPDFAGYAEATIELLCSYLWNPGLLVACF